MGARWRALRRLIAWRNLFRATVLLSCPGAAVLLLVVFLGALAPLPALAVLVAMAGGIAALLTLHFRELKRIRDYVERLRARRVADGTIPEPPRVKSLGLDRQLPAAIAESAQAREAQRRELDATIRGNETVLSNLPDPLLLVDSSGVVQRANQTAQDVFGQRLAGRPLATVLRQPEVLAAADAVVTGVPEREVEFSMPGEITRVFSARMARLVETAPSDAAAVISLHDITAIKRAEQMRADFVANASHELRTPLSSLLGFIETLQGPAKEDAEARDRFLGIMLEQARRMYSVVEDLLSLSRIELDEHSQPVGEADLVRIVDRVAGSLELRAKHKDMPIHIDIESDTLPVIGDEDQLTQVVQNLIDNAIKYGRTGTPIRVIADSGRDGPDASHPSRRGVSLSVVDQGEGIPRDHLPRLTERFYRVDTARSRNLGGTGLGLAIVKHIVSRHRGHLEIDSTVGEGSRFTVTLPTAPACADRDTSPLQAQAS